MTITQKRIERAYQRAMNVRDSTPGNVPEAVEAKYMNSYLQAFSSNNAERFTSETRAYLSQVRRMNYVANTQPLKGNRNT